MAFLQLTHHLSSYSSSSSSSPFLPFNHQTPPSYREREKPSSVLPISLLKGTPSSALTKLETPPVRHAQDNKDRAVAPTAQDKKEEEKKKDDFYLNLGTAVRTLREDLPLLFSRDLNYEIYRFIYHSFFHLMLLLLLLFFRSSCSCGYCSRVYCQSTSIGGPDPSFTPWLWWVPINLLWVGLFHVFEFWLEFDKTKVGIHKWPSNNLSFDMEVESRGDGT